MSLFARMSPFLLVGGGALMVALLLGCQRTGQDVPAQIERIVATAIDLTGTLF